MKNLWLALLINAGLIIGSTGCAGQAYYTSAPYYPGGEVYLDYNTGYWISPHGYWAEGRWYRGYPYGYYNGWGGGYRGGYYRGDGHFGGGHHR